MQADIIVYRGNGNLWWAGAIDLALKQLLPKSSDDDYFLFVNNDTTFADDFVGNLVEKSRDMNGGIVGGILRDINPPHELLSIGPAIDIWNMRVWDRLVEPGCRERLEHRGVVMVDALPGRGVLYPSNVFRRVGTMHPRCLPHYYADYEISARARRAGIPVAVSANAAAYSRREFGNDATRFGWWQRNFSKRSAANIPHKLCFYMLLGSTLQRITAMPRFVFFGLERGLRSASRKWLEKGNR